jgi:hypothetical protein
VKSDLTASTQNNCWLHAFRTLRISFPSSDRANCDTGEKFAAEPVAGSVGRGGTSLARTTWTLRGRGVPEPSTLAVLSLSPAALSFVFRR